MTDTLYEHRMEYFYDEEERVIFEQHYFKDEKSQSTEYSYGPYGEEEFISRNAKGEVQRHTRTVYNEQGLVISVFSIKEDGIETETIHKEYDEKGNLLHSINKRGYEYTAEYNAYGDPVMVHDVCTDYTRNAGTYDIYETYEYTYY